MAAQKGRLLVLKMGDGAGSETFTTIGGMKTNSMTFNNQEVDITNKDSSGWKTLLEAAGTQSVTISGAGVFDDGAIIDSIMTKVNAGSITNYQLVFGNGDYYQGAFLITSLERSGAHDGAEEFSISLASSGAISFTRA